MCQGGPHDYRTPEMAANLQLLLGTDVPPQDHGFALANVSCGLLSSGHGLLCEREYSRCRLPY